MSDSFKDLSKRNWIRTDNQHPSDEQLILGCLQRIAQAMESVDKTLSTFRQVTTENTVLIRENQKLSRKVNTLRKQLRELNHGKK